MARRPPRGYSSWSAYNAYRVRRGVERGLTPSQARGHPRRDEARASEVQRQVVIIGPTGAQETTVTGVRDLSRAGAADRAAGEFLAGRMTAQAWDRRWAGRTVGGVVLPDSERLLALGRAGRAGFADFYPRSPGTAA